MRLSIIIVEYKSLLLVKKCLQSINQHLSLLEKECVVVSNSMYNNQLWLALKQELSGAVIINAGKNLGYAGGVNLGIAQAIGDYLYVLNPDCLIRDSEITQLMDDMDKDPDWAIAGPKVVDEAGVVQPSCRRFPKPYTFLLVRSWLSELPLGKKERERYFMEDFDHEATREVDWVSGGAALVKRAAIDIFGFMDERYFLYMEDVDWCLSCWSRGLKVKYSPITKVVHAGQHQSLQGNLAERITSRHVRLHLTSLLMFFLKNGLLRWSAPRMSMIALMAPPMIGLMAPFFGAD